MTHQNRFWNPVFGFSRLEILDYVCPRCKKIIYFKILGWAICPYCGLQIFEPMRTIPRRWLDQLRRIRVD